MSLDNLISRARKQPAAESLLDYDDQSRLLDGKELFIPIGENKIFLFVMIFILATILNNLIRNYKNRDEFQ